MSDVSNLGTLGIKVGLLAVFLAISIPFVSIILDICYACDDKNLETKVIIVENKFTTRTGFLGSSNAYYFLDENGIDYEIWGGHNAVRYVKLKLNQTYQVRVNTKMMFSCEEVLVEK